MNTKKKLFNKKSRVTKLNENGKKKMSKVRKILKGGEPLDFGDLVSHAIETRDKLDKFYREIDEETAKPCLQDETRAKLLLLNEIINNLILNEEHCQRVYNHLLNVYSQLHVDIKRLYEPTQTLQQVQEIHKFNRENIHPDQEPLNFSGKEPETNVNRKAEPNTLLLVGPSYN